MDQPQGNPIRGELVPLPPAPPRARLSALLVALSPLLLRLLWWWLERPRRAAAGSRETPPSAALWERTEVRMQRRALGRWRVRIVTTRWSGPGPQPAARGGWLPTVVNSARALLALPGRRAPAQPAQLLLPPPRDVGNQD